MSFCGRASDHGAMGRRIDPSCGHIEILLFNHFSTTGITKVVVYAILHVKDTLLLFGKKSSPLSGGSGFHLSRIGPLPYVRK